MHLGRYWMVEKELMNYLYLSSALGDRYKVKNLYFQLIREGIRLCDLGVKVNLTYSKPFASGLLFMV